MNKQQPKVKPEVGKPETWSKGPRNSEQCLCGSKNWHPECYLALPVNRMSPRSIMSHAGLV